MSGLKTLVRRALNQALYLTGLTWLRLNLRTRGAVLVLTYHRVLPQALRAECFSSEGIIVTPETFDLHMRLLSRRFRPLTADEFARVLAGEQSAPPRACVVTFDDGWWDNLEYARPILEKHGVPAMIFIATDFIGTHRVFWQEELSRLLFAASKAGNAAQELFAPLGDATIIALPETPRRIAIRALVTQLKSGGAQAIEEQLERARAFVREHAVEQSAAVDRFLSWEEVRRLADGRLVELGSHGCSHVPMVMLQEAAVIDELERSRAIIRERTGAEVKDLAYPNGDCNAAVAALARRSGYRTAYSTERGYVRPGDDPHRLRRINIHDDATRTAPDFLARVAGF